jgi:hypothetical protein
MKPNQEISPAASAILDALNEVSWDWSSMEQACPRTIAAAVLRAAAKEMYFEADVKVLNELADEL